MTNEKISADYCVVGAGAMGMAFTDTLLTETDATVVLVDDRARPGGHWNDSYPFVRLHQPSSFYGVNSTPLGDGCIDEVGWNAGLSELASGTEVVSYFDHVLNRRFLPSGRVTHLPRHRYADGHATSLVTGADVTIDAATVVDATYMNVRIPSQTAPGFAVADGVTCVPLNELPAIEAPADGWVIVGAGKTGMDAVLWLLANGADPDAITWIMPRDSWILDRGNLQPGEVAHGRSVLASAASTRASAEATSLPDLFERLEAAGTLLRIDTSVEPTMYRCATCTPAEIEQLRRVQNVVRLGRVQHIESTRIVLDAGEIATTPDTVHVHCAADGLAQLPIRPIFESGRITLQTVRHCQQVFSAAFIAYVESVHDDDSVKNELATVVPHPNDAIDWARTALLNVMSLARWRNDEALMQWLNEARLDPFTTARLAAQEDPALSGVLGDVPELTMRAAENLARLLAEHDALS